LNEAVFVPLFLLPISAALSVPVGLGSKNIRNALITAVFAVSLFINTFYLTESLGGGGFRIQMGEILVNAATLYMSELVLLLGFLGVLYSFRYIEEMPGNQLYYVLYQLFIAMMIGMSASFNILVIFIFMEASSVTSAVLVMFSRRRSSISAAYRYLILSFLGAIIILIGIFLQYSSVHSLNIADLASIPSQNIAMLATIYFFGFGIKAGLLPFGPFWLPPAHSEAPIPIHTLLSAALVQVAAFDIARILGNLGIVNIGLGYLLLAVGLASMLVGSLYSLLEAWFGSKRTGFHVGPRDICGIKRVWALSTISEVGYIVVFLGLISILMDSAVPREEAFLLGFGGALIHMYNHGFCKAQLLFDSGVVIRMTEAEDLSLMGGAGRALPVMKYSFLVGGLSLGLVPFTLGVRTLRELVIGGSTPISVSIAVIVTAGLTLAGCLSAWYRAFIARPKGELNEMWKVPKLMSGPGLLMGALILVLGTIFTLEWMGFRVFGTEEIAEAIRVLVESTVKAGA